VRRIVAAAACLTVVLAAGSPATPQDAEAAKKLTLKQKKQRCLKKAAKKRTRRARRSAARRCRRRYAARRPAPKAPSRTPSASPPATVPAAPPGAPLSRYVSVTAREFYLTLSRPLVGAGQVTVELRNYGEDPHDLVVERSGTEVGRWGEIGPGGVQAKTLSLTAGSYTLLCSIEGHEEIGMKATLMVQG
jgi:plastocyanin